MAIFFQLKYIISTLVENKKYKTSEVKKPKKKPYFEHYNVCLKGYCFIYIILDGVSFFVNQTCNCI